MSAQKALGALLLLFYFGCAAYKHLKPDPEISFLENGYIEITDDEDKFELDEGKKYFMKFPRPQYENTYIVLTLTNKDLLHSYITRAFDDGKGSIIRMEDQSPQPQKMSVYQVDTSVPLYYWVIDTVQKDLLLEMQYRYVAMWRFKFELKKEEYESVLKQNTHNRSIHDAIGVSLSAREIDYTGEQTALQKQIQNLETLHGSLDEIEKIFPAPILNSTDASYLEYVALQKNLENEIRFQQKYQQALSVLSSASDPRQPLSSFIETIPEYNAFLGDSSAYQANITATGRTLIGEKLKGLPGFLESEMQKKTNIETIPLDMKAVQKLYELNYTPVPDIIFHLDKFITAFNQRVEALTSSRSDFNALLKSVQNSGTWPNDTFYTDRRVELSKIRSRIPQTSLDPFGKYQTLGCVALLHRNINEFRSTIGETDANYRRAEDLVTQINIYRQQNLYREIIRLLRAHMDLSFLIAQYPDVDNLSINQQKTLINQAMDQQLWANAESSMESLYRDDLFVQPDKIEFLKNWMVRNYEDSLKQVVETISIRNANTVIEIYQSSFTNIDSLYASPSLYPVHKLNFTSGSRSELDQKNREIESKMSSLRTDKFPATSITNLYREFSQNPQDNGVVKARAIVIHGKNYSGSDQKIKNLVAECDPAASKWITKPTAYRKIYALPTTSNRTGTNEYLVRINLQIPSEAQFPVFDVNVKLPEEVARRAGSQQWYNEITFNKKVLKNEGRFSITAPAAENNYEVQITPLQVNKTGSNILEIRFNFAAFKVFEISIMAQKPIIKKN